MAPNPACPVATRYTKTQCLTQDSVISRCALFVHTTVPAETSHCFPCARYPELLIKATRICFSSNTVLHYKSVEVSSDLPLQGLQMVLTGLPNKLSEANGLEMKCLVGESNFAGLKLSLFRLWTSVPAIRHWQYGDSEVTW